MSIIKLNNTRSNVNIGGVSRALSAAAMGLDNSLSSLQNMRFDTLAKRDDAKLQDFKNSLVGASIEDLTGLNINEAAANTSLDATRLDAIVQKQLATQRGAATDAFNFGETQRSQREAPLRAQASNLAQAGKTEELEALLGSGQLQDTAQFRRELQATKDANTQRTRSQAAFDTATDTRLDGEKLDAYARGVITQNIAAENNIRQQQQDFSNKLAGMVSFDSSGKATFDPSLTAEQRVAIGNEYNTLSAGFPKIITPKEATAGSAALAGQLKASLAQETSANAAIAQRREARKSLSVETQRELAAADMEINNELTTKKIESQRAIEAVKQTAGWTPQIVAQIQEDAAMRVGTAKSTLTKLLSSKSPLTENLDNNERAKIKETFAAFAKVDYEDPTTGDKIPITEAAQLRALESVGMLGLFQGSGTMWLWDTEKTQEYEDALKAEMAEHVRRKRVLETVAKTEEEQFKLNARQTKDAENIIKNNEKQAKSIDGVFNRRNVSMGKLTPKGEQDKINAKVLANLTPKQQADLDMGISLEDQKLITELEKELVALGRETQNN